MKRFLLFFCMSISTAGFTQTITDGIMMPKQAICTGFMYSYDQWTDYWEGELKRDNENIGTITTRSLMWVGNYGVTDKVNVIAMLPYVWTEASQGPLHGMEGIQDMSLAVKYNFFKKSIGSGELKTLGVLTYSRPLSDYTPDFLPLSIGLASQNLSWRLTASYAFTMGLYVNASGAYTWRSNVTLDRPSYFTDGQLYMSDEVKMPNVSDFVLNAGYRKGSIQADLNYSQLSTLGGGDIRRQDMPFVSNRMNFSKIGAFIMYQVPKSNGLGVRIGSSFTVAGRNIGKSMTVMGGVLYTLNFSGKE
jgi:hypothetical protein